MGGTPRVWGLEGVNQMELGRRVRFAGRGRERSWWLLLLPGVLWAVAQVLGWPLWARAVLVGLAAAAPLVVAEVRAWFGQDDTRARLVEERVTVSGGHGRLPQVQAVGLDHLRVHTARVQVPYIERDQQAKLEEAKATYQEAIDSSHADIAPLAAFNLGLLLRKQGDLARAKAAYQQAGNAGRPFVRPPA